MKSRMLISLLVIALAAAAIGGATMAWFTDEAEVADVTFTAGTLKIAADQIIPVETAKFENVNPGDKYCVGWEIKNDGSKRMELRFGALKGWVDFDLGDLKDPAHIAICPNYQDDWKIIPTGEGFEVYYTNGPIEPEDTVRLVLVVAFDGEGMGNEFQGESFTLGGQFEAVQTTNGAPEAVWEENWAAENQPDEYFNEDFEWPACCGQEDEPEEPIVPGALVAFDRIESSGTQGSTSGGSVTLTISPVKIFGAKDLNGNLLNGTYNIVFLLSGHEGEGDAYGYTKEVTFNNGNATTSFNSWQVYVVGSYKVPDDVYMKFGS